MGLLIGIFIGAALASYGIAGVIALLTSSDIMIIFYIIMLILVVLIMGVAFYSALANNGKTPKFITYLDDNKKARNIALTILGVFAMLGIVFIIVDTDTTPSQDDVTNWRTCSERSNTFYKCSWSHSENRCVCKER